jgi:hypothetical protein
MPKHMIKSSSKTIILLTYYMNLACLRGGKTKYPFKM